MGAPEANDKPYYFYLTGAFGSMVPFALAVSGPPEPFLDFSGSSSIFMECLASVVEMPFCLLEMSPWLELISLLAACYKTVSYCWR